MSGSPIVENRSMLNAINSLLVACVIAVVLPMVAVRAQPLPGAAPAPAQPEPVRDALGRSTPRGTVLGFLDAARRGEDALARQYLNTRLGASDAQRLARQLLAVLDARLPARLPQLSDAPEGSRSNPLTPNQEIVGTVTSDSGDVDIVVERVTRPTTESIWLFSTVTLDSIPRLYEEVTQSRAFTRLPPFLVDTRLGGIRLAEWLVVLVGLPVLYYATVLLNWMLTPVIGLLLGRIRAFERGKPNALPAPARLLLLALISRWLISSLPLSLLVRQYLSSAAILITIGATAWLLILLNGELERHIRQRLLTTSAATGSLLRVGRRVVDLLVVLAGLLATLRQFGVDLTPVLAGLGVGGIAVALAAQKTLENVIAGVSLIFDQAVRVGDFLKVGEIQGTVDYIGLRSTRIRTLDRTVVSVPNGQIANMTLETLSARDKFWFHPMVGLRYETTPEQLRGVIDGIRRLLAGHPSVDRESVRVRFLRLGSFSLDVDVFAYVDARDWNHFLEIQEQLLFSVADVVETAGTGFAFPTQTIHVADSGPHAGAEAAASSRLTQPPTQRAGSGIP
jgi:MscS family membrane protein